MVRASYATSASPPRLLSRLTVLLLAVCFPLLCLSAESAGRFVAAARPSDGDASDVAAGRAAAITPGIAEEARNAGEDDWGRRGFFKKKNKYGNKGSKKRPSYSNKPYSNKPTHSGGASACEPTTPCTSNFDCTHAFPCRDTFCDFNNARPSSSYFSYSSNKYGNNGGVGVCKCTDKSKVGEKCLPKPDQLDNVAPGCLDFPPGQCNGTSECEVQVRTGSCFPNTTEASFDPICLNNTNPGTCNAGTGACDPNFAANVCNIEGVAGCTIPVCATSTGRCTETAALPSGTTCNAGSLDDTGCLGPFGTCDGQGGCTDLALNAGKICCADTVNDCNGGNPTCETFGICMLNNTDQVECEPAGCGNSTVPDDFCDMPANLGKVCNLPGLGQGECKCLIDVNLTAGARSTSFLYSRLDDHCSSSMAVCCPDERCCGDKCCLEGSVCCVDVTTGDNFCFEGDRCPCNAGDNPDVPCVLPGGAPSFCCDGQCCGEDEECCPGGCSPIADNACPTTGLCAFVNDMTKVGERCTQNGQLFGTCGNCGSGGGGGNCPDSCDACVMNDTMAAMCVFTMGTNPNALTCDPEDTNPPSCNCANGASDNQAGCPRENNGMGPVSSAGCRGNKNCCPCIANNQNGGCACTGFPPS